MNIFSKPKPLYIGANLQGEPMPKKMTIKSLVSKHKKAFKDAGDYTTSIYLAGMLYGIKRAVEIMEDDILKTLNKHEL